LRLGVRRYRGAAAQQAGEAAGALGVDADIGGHAGAQRRLAGLLDQPQPNRQVLKFMSPAARAQITLPISRV